MARRDKQRYGFAAGFGATFKDAALSAMLQTLRDLQAQPEQQQQMELRGRADVRAQEAHERGIRSEQEEAPLKKSLMEERVRSTKSLADMRERRANLRSTDVLQKEDNALFMKAASIVSSSRSFEHMDPLEQLDALNNSFDILKAARGRGETPKPKVTPEVKDKGGVGKVREKFGF